MKRYFKNYFIPCKENGYRPYSLKTRSIMMIVALAIFANLIAVSIISPTFSDKFNFTALVLPAALVDFANNERSERELGILKENELLKRAAQLKAEDMAKRGYFSHINPDGEEPWYYLEEAGYDYQFAGENLAVNFIDSKDVHDSWMRSEKHKDNILFDKFSEIGIATAKGEYKGREAIFVVQFFSKPARVQKEVIPVKTEVDDKVYVVDVSKPEVKGASVAATPASLRWSTTYLLVGLLVLVLFSLLLKIFIKPSIQYKDIIFSALLLTAILISAIVINNEIFKIMGEVRGLLF